MTCFEEEAKNLTKENMDVQDKWNLIVSSCHNATAQTADEKTKKKEKHQPRNHPTICKTERPKHTHQLKHGQQ